MPLRRTKRSDGRQRSRWKDGSHETVESTNANESRHDEVAFEANHQTESLVDTPPMLGWSCEPNVSSRDRPAKTGADARIDESAANAEVCLALRPYGRKLVGVRLRGSRLILGMSCVAKLGKACPGWSIGKL